MWKVTFKGYKGNKMSREEITLEDEIYAIMEPLKCIQCNSYFPKDCEDCEWDDCYEAIVKLIKAEKKYSNL